MTASSISASRPTVSSRRRRGLRRAIIALTVLVLLVALLLGGAGWYYAGQIDAQALAVDPPPGTPQRNVTVTAVADGRVTLRARGDEDAHALDSPDVYGLLWSGGSGVLTGLPQRGTAGTSTRALQVVSGTAPSPGTPASTSRYVWTDPTAAAGVSFQDVRYPCAGDTCPAWFVPGRSSTWMVMVHGKGATREEPLRAMVAAVRGGLPVLDINYRNDPGAPATRRDGTATAPPNGETLSRRCAGQAITVPNTWCCSAPRWAARSRPRSSSTPGWRG